MTSCTGEVKTRVQATASELTFKLHIADFPVREHGYGVLEQSDVTDAEGMDIAWFRPHPLRGFEPRRWSVGVNGSWRLTFEYKDGHAFVSQYEPLMTMHNPPHPGEFITEVTAVRTLNDRNAIIG